MKIITFFVLSLCLLACGAAERRLEKVEADLKNIEASLKKIEKATSEILEESKKIKNETKVIADSIGNFRNYTISAKKVKIYK